MKNFTLLDLWQRTNSRYLPDGEANLGEYLLPWQKMGLTQTSTGYGKKLTSRYKILFEGKLRRVYITQFSNSGSAWFLYKGEKIFI